MTETIFVIDPGSVVYAHYMAVVTLIIVALVCFGLVARLGRRSWWAVIVVVLSIPTIIVSALRGAGAAQNMPVSLFIVDVFLPLALLGLPAAIVGGALGAMLRKIIHSTKT